MFLSNKEFNIEEQWTS